MECKKYNPKHTFYKYKFPAHSLPSIYGWHLLSQQNDTNDKNFGYNFYDMFHSKKLKLYTHSVTINTLHSHSIVLINVGSNDIKIKNINTNDVYLLSQNEYIILIF